MVKYEVELTHKQLRVIANLLELGTRIGIGQFDEVGRTIEEMHHNNLDKDAWIGLYWDLRNTLFDPLKKKLLGFDGGASYGIANEKVCNEAKIAYDMMKAMQQVIAKEEDHSSSSVWHNGDSLHLGSEPTLNIRKIFMEEGPGNTFVGGCKEVYNAFDKEK